ncbi:MAG: hypothetical protein HQL94_07790 [Magnetococcales bacterium]|nr:hypothetical protein [Magnetococcales bacterium]
MPEMGDLEEVQIGCLDTRRRIRKRDRIMIRNDVSMLFLLFFISSLGWVFEACAEERKESTPETKHSTDTPSAQTSTQPSTGVTTPPTTTSSPSTGHTPFATPPTFATPPVFASPPTFASPMVTSSK